MFKDFLKINKIIKILVLGRVMVEMADGFLMPIFAIFIVQKIAPGELKVAGFAIAIYWLTKSIIQVPLSRYLDKLRGEKDDLLALIVGTLIFALVPLLYIFINNKYELYLVQVMLALGGALFVIPWFSIFTRHVDKFRIGFEWSINSSALGFGLVISTALGGFLADKFGFNSVFIMTSIFHFVGAFSMIFLYKFLIPKDHLEKVYPEHLKK